MAEFPVQTGRLTRTVVGEKDLEKRRDVGQMSPVARQIRS